MKRYTLFILLAFLYSAVHLGAQTRTVNDYSIISLQTYQYRTSPVTIQNLAFKNEIQYAYNVTYTSMGLTVSARLNIPAINPQNIKGIIVMLRGHQSPVNYYTGKGTENPSVAYLEQGWAVIAPDFLGYASSSPTPSPTYLHQFYSTINAVEIYKSMEQPVFQYNSSVTQADRIPLPSSFKKIVIWGHSNGGQVSLHFLEVIQKPVTAVLWAPVGLSFPESAEHYGRGSASWVVQFRKDYTSSNFSLINNLNKIAPGTRILLHQGVNDTSVPKAWNDALSKAIESENTRRDSERIGRIIFRYEIYAEADHNLRPLWSTVQTRDVAFWEAN
ncbi:MAG: alpha/beta hydrolase [Treponema sp.]|nr:alpha/beta hydrolase [Treponema sp.]